MFRAFLHTGFAMSDGRPTFRCELHDMRDVFCHARGMPDTTTGTLDDTLVSQGCFQLGKETIVVQGFVGLLTVGAPVARNLPATWVILHNKLRVQQHFSGLSVTLLCDGSL